MKLLVTGGAGFIGSNFIHHWLEQHPNDEITNLDLLTYAGNENNLTSIATNPHYHFVKGDIREAELVNDLIKAADVIVHFAAESHVDRSILGPEAFVETNIKGTFVLLEAARQHNKRLHHISTDEVFGALELDSKNKFTEATPYDPSSPYSASKAAADHLVRAYHRTYGTAITITNCSNNFGPYQHPEKFISRMITNLIDGQPAKVYGDGKYVRDWLYVKDHCRAIELILQKGKVGETYLVGGMSRDINNLEVALLIIEHLKGVGYSRGSGTLSSEFLTPSPDTFKLPDTLLQFVTDRPGHDRRYAVDWGKINRELGWQPEHSFEDWLKETITWYQQNEAWWRPLKEQAEAIYKK